MAKKSVKIVFPRNIVKEPVIYLIGRKYNIVTNIRRANITPDEGWVILELEGESEEIRKAEDYLREKGISVEYPESELN
ncbi:NIL domain-containing protein [Candidatus Woesearchaeota archaeon]|nr:NIL domain-containing protein [Candidatus Woesearchaeota archaeon]